MGFLPVNLNIEGRRCVIVGGDAAAHRKCLKFLRHGADVRIICPLSDITWPETEIDLVRRPFEPTDVQDSFLVVAATDNPKTNRLVAQAARAAGALVQQVDMNEGNDFTLPATLENEEFSLSIATHGASSAFAAWLRDQVAAWLEPGFAAYCALARGLRGEVAAALPLSLRHAFFTELLRTDVLDLLIQGQGERAEVAARELLTQFREGDPPPTARLGKIYLVGSGPGDAGLITIKGARCLQAAEVVLYDNLVNEDIVERFCARAQKIDVGKHKGNHTSSQEEIIAMLIEQARRGRTVVRLKGGDPLIFGRGGEEARAIRHAGITFEFVPGISCVSAVPTYAGIPVTDREAASSFGVYSAHLKAGEWIPDDRWRGIAQGPDTLIFFMAKTRLRMVAEKLIEYGRSPFSPIALIIEGTTNRQHTITGTLRSALSCEEIPEFSGPGLVVVGDVIHEMNHMRWFEGPGVVYEEIAEGGTLCPKKP